MTLRSSFLYAKKVVFSKTIAGETLVGKRSFVGAAFCIAVSLIPLVTVLSVTAGMFSGITDRMINLYSRDVSLFIPDGSPALSSAAEFTDATNRLTSVYGVKRVFPEVRAMALAATSTYRVGAFVRAIKPDKFFADEKFTSLFELKEGSFNLEGERKAVLGEKIASDLCVHTGDKLKLVSVNVSGKKVIPKAAQFEVSGIVSCGYQELDAAWVFVSMEDAFEAIAKSSCQFFVGVETNDPYADDLFLTVEALANFCAADAELLGSEVSPWQQVNEAELENFESNQAMLVVITAMIVVVAAIGISSSVLMIVMERKKEIALLQCVGASSAGICVSFVLVGLAAGFLGVLVGLPCAILISANINGVITTIEGVVNLFGRLTLLLLSDKTQAQQFHLLDPAYYLQDIPTVLPFKQIGLIAVCTLILSILVSIVPSLKAAIQKPCDTLRKT